MKYEVRSFDSARKDKPPYVVEAHDQGKRWSCTCPHWLYRLAKSGTRCKHIDQVIADNAQQERNERLQAEIAATFEKGYGFDLDDDEEKPDVDVASA